LPDFSNVVHFNKHPHGKVRVFCFSGLHLMPSAFPVAAPSSVPKV
jgi:hypothetical protein